MFGSNKKKKRPEISGPLNFEHRVHTGFDPQQGTFVGLPPQWAGIVQPSASRPSPIVDPSIVTPMMEQAQAPKVKSSTSYQCLLIIL